jgi:hypothetical protein
LGSYNGSKRQYSGGRGEYVLRSSHWNDEDATQVSELPVSMMRLNVWPAMVALVRYILPPKVSSSCCSGAMGALWRRALRSWRRWARYLEDGGIRLGWKGTV